MANKYLAGKKGTNDIFNDVSTIMGSPIADETIDFGTFVKYATAGGEDNKVKKVSTSTDIVLGVAEATGSATDLDTKKYIAGDSLNIIREGELYLPVDPGATVKINRDSKLGISANGKLVAFTDPLKIIGFEGRSSTVVTPAQALNGETALIYFKLIK